MNYPEFFDGVQKVAVYDPLADKLGAAEDGIITISYPEVVKLAGHSCPTVAGAYLMTLRGLEALYGDEMPVRGNIKIEMQQKQDEGVCGVTANVISFITGASGAGGFKGVGGFSARCNLLSFGNHIDSEVRLSRIDSGKSVNISYDPSSIPGNPLMQEMMQKTFGGTATKEEENDFHKMWQGRVEMVLNNPTVVVVK